MFRPGQIDVLNREGWFIEFLHCSLAVLKLLIEYETCGDIDEMLGRLRKSMALSLAAEDKPASGNHETTRMRHGSVEVEIDKEIAPLLQEIWDAGILTQNSCQEVWPGWTLIEFFCAEDAQVFIDIADCEDLHDDIRLNGHHAEAASPTCWRYIPRVRDLSEVGGKRPMLDDGVTPLKLVIHMAVCFPRSQIEILERRFRRYSEAAELAEGRSES